MRLYKNYEASSSEFERMKLGIVSYMFQLQEPSKVT